MLANFRHDLRAQVSAAIEHRHDNAADLDLCVRAGVAHLLDDVNDFYKPLEREIFALDWRENFLSGSQRVRHQNAERGWTIEENKIESLVRAQDRQRLRQAHEMIAHPRVIKGDFDRGGMAEVRPEELRLLEALLFASAEPLDEQTLAARLPDGVEVRVALERLQQEYAPRGVNLVSVTPFLTLGPHEDEFLRLCEELGTPSRIKGRDITHSYRAPWKLPTAEAE